MLSRAHQKLGSSRASAIKNAVGVHDWILEIKITHRVFGIRIVRKSLRVGS